MNGYNIEYYTVFCAGSIKLFAIVLGPSEPSVLMCGVIMVVKLFVVVLETAGAKETVMQYRPTLPNIFFDMSPYGYKKCFANPENKSKHKL